MSRLRVGVLMTRKPLQITPLGGFELSYLQYRQNLDEGQQRTFNPDFYYKRGSLNLKRFTDAQKENKGFLSQLAESELLEWIEQCKETETNSKDDNLQSLDRKPMEWLYLLLKIQDTWTLPNGLVETKSLREVPFSLISVGIYFSNVFSW